MRVRFTPEQATFRQEVLDFLKENLPSDRDQDDDRLRGDLGWSPEFSKKLAAKNWVAPAWPKEYGGSARSHMEQVIFNEEMAYHRAPIGAHRRGVFYVGPILILYGTDEQKRKHLNAITSGTGYYCQLFSEPGAGSDLASLQTRAVRDGDDYVVNGQKIWTSDGHRSDYGWLVARTDPDAPKHKGISTFIFDMKAPGVTVRPLVNLQACTASTRCSSTTSACPARTWWAKRTAAGTTPPPPSTSNARASPSSPARAASSTTSSRSCAAVGWMTATATRWRTCTPRCSSGRCWPTRLPPCRRPGAFRTRRPRPRSC